MTYYAFDSLLLKTGWLSPAYVGIDQKGTIQYLAQEPPATPETPIQTTKGAALPGFQNAHSHAFQYGMAGMAEQHAPGARDDFWSWREAMYACAETFTPEQNEQVATTLYRHLLRNGYTSVVEFHYLHHAPTGRPYANLAEMGERLVAAARSAGIKLTLVPVFYQKGHFGQEPQPRQRRFISTTPDAYLNLLDASRQAVAHYPRRPWFRPWQEHIPPSFRRLAPTRWPQGDGGMALLMLMVLAQALPVASLPATELTSHAPRRQPRRPRVADRRHNRTISWCAANAATTSSA
ncbi:MAG: hypothetical protein EOO36_12740 [Cytophagaceae bacterium]|nr:MAG: hypothetical protein EOO36_12740 [Cytophagaceae bacterium]